VLLVGVGVLYFAFLPEPVAKSLPLTVSFMGLPEPDIEAVAEPQFATPTETTTLVAEELQPVLVKRVLSSRKAQNQADKSPVQPSKVPHQPIEDPLNSYYPDAYVSKRLNGDVLLRLKVESGTGKVVGASVEIASPYGLFNDAAKEAALSLMPTVTIGLPSEVLLPVRFRYGR
jgi:TonB family protein